MSEKSVLLITYNYKPMINPRSLRWSLIAEQLAKSGIDVYVVCSKVSAEPDYEKLNSVHVFRVGARSQPNPKSDATAVNTPLFKMVLKFIYNHFIKYIMWPDSNFLWLSPSEKKCNEIIIKNNIKNIISISHPFSGHVVGERLKKKHNNLNWIMDIGDPFAFLEYVKINNKFLFNRRNFSYERKVIKMSDRQTVTTDLTKDVYKKLDYECEESMRVVPPLLTKTDLVDKVNLSKKNKWVFVGTLYKEIRSPEYLLKLFKEFLQFNKDYELHFYGEHKMCEDDFEMVSELIGQRIFLHGLVSPEVVTDAIVDAQVLVNIGNKTSYQLPSKLVEYMALGASILNIKSIENDSSEEFLSDYTNKIFISQADSIKKSTQIVTESLQAYKVMSKEEIMDLSKDYFVEEISKKYSDLLIDS